MLFVNNQAVGTAFAVDEQHVITARHNMYNEVPDVVIGALAQILTISIPTTSSSSLSSSSTDKILTENVSTDCIDVVVVAGGANYSEDSEDWLILKRKDNGTFRNIILVRVTDVNQILQSTPYITIYHYPLDYASMEKINPIKVRSETRVIDVQNGLLICNDKCTISGGSCGAPYVENTTFGAIGLHIYGSSATMKVPAGLQSAIQDIPCGLHFVQGSSVVQALQMYKILKP